MNDIDFVIAWVDGNDPQWAKRKSDYTGNHMTDGQESRYRDWGLLRYWFRGVELFAPWVRKIWFICDQKPPQWLNQMHPKLEIVRHDDYLPDDYLPCFSSHPIELNLHRIGGLSDKFVYFNDDMFLLQPVREESFFIQGLPRDCALINTIPTDDLAKDPEGRVFYMFLNNTSYINRDYDFHKCFKAHVGKWLSPIYGKDMFRNMILCIWPRLVGTVESHLPQPYLKETFIEAWVKDFDILDKTSRHHIRDDSDVNQWFIRLHSIMEGKFVVRKPARNAVYTIGKSNSQIIDAILNQRHEMICINDRNMDEETFLRSREELKAAFASLFVTVSTFEV